MAVNKVVLGTETLLDLTGDTATAEDVAEGKTFHLASGVQTVGTASGGGSGVIPFGRVDSTSTSTVFTATVDGVTELVDGTCVMLHNGVVTSASGFTVNVNGLGAKPVYNNLATGNDVTPTEPTRDTTIFNINYTMLFVYDSQLEGGAWVCYRGYDANTNTIGYQLRTNSGRRPASDTGYRYRIWLTSPDGAKWVPINTSSATNATSSRTLNTRAIDPFGPIAYNSTNGTCDSGSNLPAATMWRVYTLTIGYSYVKTLTAWDSVYLKCLPSTDGSAVMKDVVQALPTSKDGFIYILLGTAYSATGMELQSEHPVYWHDGTGIRLWTGAEVVTSVNGSTGAITGLATTSQVGAKQDTLVSGTNIKTINGESLLGSGDLTISGGGSSQWTDISSLAWTFSEDNVATIHAKTNGSLVCLSADVSGFDFVQGNFIVHPPSGYEPSHICVTQFTTEINAEYSDLVGNVTASTSGAIYMALTNHDAYSVDEVQSFTLIYPID